MSSLTKYYKVGEHLKFRWLAGNQPVHFNRIRSETHSILEVTSQRCKRVHMKMLTLSYVTVKLQLLFGFVATLTPFLVLRAHSVLGKERTALRYINSLNCLKEDGVS